jgi:metallo-beta-lactamase class B
VLIDGATPEAAAGIAENIRRLGFDPRDVRILLNSHEHVDHAGGLAALKRETGAVMLARAEGRRGLESGTTDAGDPQAGTISDFPGVAVEQIVADGEVVRLGPLALTAHATHGHTAGSTSWSWQSCEGGECRRIVYADSLTAVGPASYRFSNQPLLVARFRAAFERVAGLPCDILITPHPSASNLFERLAGRAPLRDPTACRRYAEGAQARLDQRLATEGAR